MYSFNTGVNPLEQWMIDQITKKINEFDELNIINSSQLTFNDVKKYQFYQFKLLLNYVYNNSIFYKHLFEKYNINIENIQFESDIEKIPFTVPRNIAESPYHFLCQSRKNIAREFSSSGTSGIRKKICYSEEELIHISSSIGAAMKLAGMNNKKDTLQIMYPTITGTWDPGLVVSKGCDIIGCNSIINGSRDFENQLISLKENDVNYFIAQASFLYNLSISKEKEIKNGDFNIKTIISSSEPLVSEKRKKIEEIWGCDVIRQYGTTELGLANAIECKKKNGYHTNCADLLYEVIDPITKKRVPDGTVGELVVTTLNRTCMPLIRYRTGDITSITSNYCVCGAKVDQRISDLTRL